MHLVGVGSATATAPRRRASDRPEREAGEPQSRALVAVAVAAPASRSLTMTRRPAAPFLAHLIATHMQLPQTRERRRAEPDAAIAAYSAINAAYPKIAGRTLGKSV